MTATLSWDPRTGGAVPAPPESSEAEVEAAVAAARSAASGLAATAPGERARWLEAVADRLDAHVDDLAALADAETRLGLPRLTGECGRLAGALRFYASVAREGSYLDATIDTGEQDLRRIAVPLGPVAVFGASNFPFLFGVLGNDTGSALAAGCPVVVKAHPAHPRLSAELARLATDALREAGAPDGTLALVSGFAAGATLVTHPAIRAVGFTGSQHGGLTLWRLASARREVIPVYAEMGTVNTAVVTAAGSTRADEIATGFVGSFTLGMGQFCTKPGLLLVPAGSGLVDAVAAALTASAPAGWMLTERIAAGYQNGIEHYTAHGGTVVARVDTAGSGWWADAALVQVGAAALAADPELLEECFGPVALIAEYADQAQLDAVLDALPGSLATAVHGGGADDPEVAVLVSRLAARCGRVVVDGWPTGVAVTWAQQHGGPWPATTAPSTSSVGAAALRRFVRPVAFQDVPGPALPAALRDDNPWSLPRRIDGTLEA